MKTSFIGGALAGGAYLIAQTLPSLTDPWAQRTQALAMLATALGGLVFILTGLVKVLVWGAMTLKGKPMGAAPTTTPQLVMGGLLVALLAMGGCLQSRAAATQSAPSAEQRLIEAKQAYTLALNTASDLREAGVIDDANYWRIEAARVVARTAIDSLDGAVASGGTLSPESLAQLETAVKAIREALRKSHDGPTSRPRVHPGPAHPAGYFAGAVHRQQQPGRPGDARAEGRGAGRAGEGGHPLVLQRPALVAA